MITHLVEQFEAVERQLAKEIGCQQNPDTIQKLDRQIEEIYGAIRQAPIRNMVDKVAAISFHLDRLCAANAHLARSNNMLEIRRIIRLDMPVQGPSEEDWDFDVPRSKVSNIA